MNADPVVVADAAPSSIERAIARLHALAGDREYLTIQQVCAFVGLSESKFYLMRKARTFPIPEMAPRLGRPRFHVEDCAHYVRTGAVCRASERLSVVHRKRG